MSFSSQSPSGFGAGHPLQFGTTQWTAVLQAGQGAEEALLKLCRIYWPPLFAYIRRRGHPLHEAQDLTQSFFAHLLSRQALETVSPCKGRFRSFLLASLKHFLDNEWHKAQTIKRGGQQVFISWDDLTDGARENLEPSDQLTPEKLYDRQWALMLLERVMKQLQQECAAAHKEEQFQQLRRFLTGDDPGLSYQEVAQQLKISEGAVKVTIHRLRRRFGQLIRDQIGRTVDSPDKIDEEIRQLFAALE